MAGELVPITPSVLAWAIVESGLAPDVVAESTGVPLSELNQWLTGAVKPSTAHVEALARTLRRQFAVFLLPYPPPERRPQSQSLEWIETMERESVLCRIEVAHLDRAYRHARRAKDEVVRRCPEMASVVENAFESIRQLYTDAHVHSNGVPLSHRQFAEIGLSELPDWARNDD